MNSIILTDYKNVKRTLDMCVSFESRINDKIAYIIVDNSAESCGKNFLLDNSIAFSESVFCDKAVYAFSYENIVVTIIDNDGNFGYAIGNNIGAKYASEYYQSDFYIFSNSDLEFPYDIDLSLISDLINNQSNVGVIGPDVQYKGLYRQNPRLFRGITSQMIVGDFNSRWFHGKFNNKLNSLDKNPNEGKTDWVTGCFMIVSAQKFDAVGGFDENTFLYGEEMIISRRMLNNGYITYYLPRISIIHNHQGVDNRNMRKILHKSLKYYYKTYEGANILLIVLSDISFAITEFGYFIYHDLIKVKLFKRG